MDNIPNRLKCAYCQRNYTHGGECKNPKYDDKGCLIYKPDPKGCIRKMDVEIPVYLYSQFPKLGVWTNRWQLNGVDTELKIEKIYGFDWDKKKGYLIITCRCECYVNEFHKDYTAPKKQPNLKLIK